MDEIYRPVNIGSAATGPSGWSISAASSGPLGAQSPDVVTVSDGGSSQPPDDRRRKKFAAIFVGAGLITALIAGVFVFLNNDKDQASEKDLVTLPVEQRDDQIPAVKEDPKFLDATYYGAGLPEYTPAALVAPPPVVEGPSGSGNVATGNGQVVADTGAAKSSDGRTYSNVGNATGSGQVSCPAASGSGGLVAWATGDGANIYDAPNGNVIKSFQNPNYARYGAPLTFLVVENAGDWLRVLLPSRPNGSQGWVPASQVRLENNPYRIVIQLSTRVMCLYNGSSVSIATYVGVGTRSTPTPTGLYFVQSVLDTGNPGGAYGPYALGTSAFSDVLNQFGSGDGQIGIHGTNQPGALGTAVSHGCVRVRNDIITTIAHTVPLGTPIELIP